jgi:uncharacterized protein YlzI (FlbEa/FlbD family)
VLVATTELTLVSGDRHHVEGSVDEVEARIIDAARGSILQFAKLTDVESGQPLAVNPHHVLAMRVVGP